MGSRLAGRVVVVTGAARGMGRAQAEHIAAEGAEVVAVDILDDAGSPAVRWSRPGTISYRHLDVTDADGWAALAGTLERVDGLVNNAGIAARGRLPDVDLLEWRAAFDVNVTGPLLGIQALRPLMSAGSSIVNIISVAGLAGHAAAAYTASKWALRGLSRTASLEFGSAGIRVNAVFPGFIDTPLMAGASTAFREVAVRETPLGRVGAPADVAPLVVYLLSAESGFVTGAEIVVDGGMTAHVSHKSIADATRGG